MEKLLIGVISLGCDKNRVDTENILTSAAQCGFGFAAQMDDADIAIINTCAFLEAARAEAVDAILDAAAYKAGKLRCLLVAGCLPMRYLEELKSQLPEVDLWLTPKQYGSTGKLLHAFFDGEPTADAAAPRRGRLLTTPEHYAYLKIADGCSNHCTFCMIPSIRGPYVSVPPEVLEEEARALAENGVKELILVAQDTTRYGSDRPEFGTLSSLCRRLSQIPALEYLRLLYCYPEAITDELLEEIAKNPKILPYLDIPLQHADDAVLKRMNRRSNRASIAALLQKLRARIPGLTVRSTFMVGFPGETEEAVDNLCRFLREQRLDNVGFFKYSCEEDTPSAKLLEQIPETVKDERLERVIAIQQEIAFERAEATVGKTLMVRYDDIDYERNRFIGRPLGSSPEIDPVVYFEADFVDIGQLYTVTITGTDGYDLLGKIKKD